MFVSFDPDFRSSALSTRVFVSRSRNSRRVRCRLWARSGWFLECAAPSFVGPGAAGSPQFSPVPLALELPAAWPVESVDPRPCVPCATGAVAAAAWPAIFVWRYRCSGPVRAACTVCFPWIDFEDVERRDRETSEKERTANGPTPVSTLPSISNGQRLTREKTRGDRDATPEDDRARSADTTSHTSTGG